MMKKIFLVIITLISISIYSQSLIIPSADSDSTYLFADENSSSSTFELKSHFKNDTSIALNIGWRIDSVSRPTTWNNISLCESNTCVDIITGDETNAYVLDTDVTSVFKAGFTTNDIEGVGFLRAKLSSGVLGEPAIYFTFKLEAENIISGISTTLETTKISIFPNPTSSIVNVNIDGDERIQKIIIYNVIGKAINTLTDISSETTINVKDYEKGLYIIKLFGEDDSIFHTQSFVKK